MSTEISEQEEQRYRLHRRFDRLGRLYGDSAVEHLMAKRIAIFGLGGVGSWAAEALARSAIGTLTVVDFDFVCVTNTNRQLQAIKGAIGKSKAELLAERLRLINPQGHVVAIQEFYKAETSDRLLTPPDADRPYDFVLDCIDNMTAKADLLSRCVEAGIPVVSSMGAAGKLDPTRIKVADLARTQVCPMARELRKILRRKHGFDKDGDMNITAVYSDEPREWPKELTYDGGKGFRCVCPKPNPEHSCDNRNLIDGTAAFVTGAFGLVAAGETVNRLTDGLIGGPSATSKRKLAQEARA